MKKQPRDTAVEPPPVAIDAAPVTTEAPKVKPADASLTVEMDTWCNLTIDKAARGQLNSDDGRVAAGPTRDRLHQSAARETWTQTVELAAGEKKTVKGTLVPEIAVLVKVSQGNEVLIDKQKVPNGATRQIKRGSHRVEVRRMGKVVDSAFVQVSQACTLVDRPAIACR